MKNNCFEICISNPRVNEYMKLIPNPKTNISVIVQKIIEKSIEEEEFIDIVYNSLNSNDLQKFQNQYKKIFKKRKDFIDFINGDIEETNEINEKNKKIVVNKQQKENKKDDKPKNLGFEEEVF
jgi:hypothetical protein